MTVCPEGKTAPDSASKNKPQSTHRFFSVHSVVRRWLLDLFCYLQAEVSIINSVAVRLLPEIGSAAGRDAQAAGWLSWFRMKKSFLLLLISVLLSGLPPAEGAVKDKKDTSGAEGVSILLYHRFGPTVADSMTVTTAVFESHLRYLKDHGYTVIPLSRLVDNCRGKTATPLPSKAVVLVADDGHKSVYTCMLPLIKKYRVPVTLFLYPSAISNAPYAMTWEQIRNLKRTGLFNLQGHTYWHPNFKMEKKRLSSAEYDKFVDMQLRKSKEKLEKELGDTINMLAWPFGIYDDQLVKKAAAAGYVAAFTIERRPVRHSDNIMELPRYLMRNKDSGNAFAAIVSGESP